TASDSGPPAWPGRPAMVPAPTREWPGPDAEACAHRLAESRNTSHGNPLAWGKEREEIFHWGSLSSGDPSQGVSFHRRPHLRLGEVASPKFRSATARRSAVGRLWSLASGTIGGLKATENFQSLPISPELFPATGYRARKYHNCGTLNDLSALRLAGS